MEPVSAINATASTISAGKAVFKGIRAIFRWAAEEPEPPARKRRKPLTVAQLDYKIEQAADVVANLQAATILARRKLARYTGRRKRCATVVGRRAAKRRGDVSSSRGKRRAPR